MQHSWKLSKTLFMRGRQCEKAMYLHKYHREQAKEPNLETKRITGKGFRFEEQFRKERFPYGIDLQKEWGKDYAGNINATRLYLEKKEPVCLFEAAIVFNQILILVDVLFLHGDGAIEIYEIKNSSALKPEALWDASLQYYVCKGFLGERLTGFYMVLQGSRGRFKQIEITQQALNKQPFIQEEIDRFLDILDKNQEPAIAMGNQCYKPHACGFLGYCLENKSN